MAPSKYVPERRTNRNLIGSTVAKLRLQQGLTQQDLAGRAAVIGWEISRDAVKRIESGEREITDIEIKYLSLALRVPPAVLVEKLDSHPRLSKLANRLSRKEKSGEPSFGEADPSAGSSVSA